MKSFLHLASALALCLTLMMCCQSQTQPQATGPIDSTGQTGEVLRNLIPDSVAISSLTEDDRTVLNLRYAGDPSVISYRVVKDPFPQGDSLTVFRKLQCNMSISRNFVAERTAIKFDYTLNRPDLVWEGNLKNTGVISDRLDYNIIWLQAKPDTTIVGGYRFYYGKIRVSNTEGYELETFPPYPYFVLIHYDPSKLPLATCNGITPSPVTATR